MMTEEQDKLEGEEHSDGIYPNATVKIAKEQFSVYELKRQHEKYATLVIAPQFQRGEVWNFQQKSELIESILMGIPIPMMYFFEDKEGKRQVVDGRQRLTTVFDFLDNQFALSNLKILPEQNGKSFKDLEPILQSTVERYQLFIYVVQPPTPEKIKFEIFDRVNRGGTRLNEQEMRNALYQGKATELLNRLANTTCFQQATDHAINSLQKEQIIIMINHLKIKQFKCIDEEEFTFQNLTILTGLNSAGKSSVIQSILLMSHYFGQQKFLSENIISFAINSNMYVNAKEFSITLNEACLTKNIDETNQQGSLPNFTNEQDLFHIDANRLGPEEFALYSSENKIGQHGEFIFSYYEQNKNKAIEKSLVKSENSDTLWSNIDYWLSYISEEKVALITERVSATHIKVSYQFNQLPAAISPNSLGAGTSYVVKILIVCLLAKPGNILLLENPEVHLHPKAQAKLGEFLAFVASHGVQVVVETHCEHLINQVRYEVYKHHIQNHEVAIYYTEDSTRPFEKIEITQTGHFARENKEASGNFPTGFFNSTLKALLEIG